MGYSIQELSYLKEIENHKIVYDGWDFIWYANRGNGLELHSIKCFKDYKELLSYIHYWTNKYKKEYLKKDNYLDNMLNQLLIDIQIKNICNNKNLKTKEKIQMIYELNPNVKATELAKLLDLSKMAISKQIKKVYSL